MKNIKSAIEALLFVNGDPLSIKKLSLILDQPTEKIKEAISLLKEEYNENDRGFHLIEVNKSYQFATSKQYYEYIKKLSKYSPSKGLSKVNAEVLAIIAYNQPITKYDIDSIRGVNSDKAIQQLLNRDLIEQKGRLEKVGRPMIYGTTEMFLKSFGIKSIKELPDISMFEVDKIEGLYENT